MATESSMQHAAGETGYKRTLRKLIVVFAVMMGGLTLMSSTLLTHSLPHVTVVRPTSGVLTHVVSGQGTIRAAEIADHYANGQWPVERVHVQPGERVTAGQPLVTFDTGEARDALLDERARLEQRRLDVERLRLQYVDAERNGDERQTRLLMLSIESALLDVEVQERRVGRLERQLAGGGVLTASVAGAVVELNATAGLPVPAGTPAVRVANEAAAFEFVAPIPAAKAQYVGVGDEAEVIVPALGYEQVHGTVRAVRDVPAGSDGGGAYGAAVPDAADADKELVVALRDDRLQGGEAGEVHMAKRMPPSTQLVPNAAIRRDIGGTFVLVLQEREGPLGVEYYARRASVEIGGADDAHASVESGLGPRDLVIVAGSKPVEDGDRVMIAS